MSMFNSYHKRNHLDIVITVNVEISAPYIFWLSSRFLKICKKIYSAKIKFYYTINRGYCEKREYKSAQNYQFSQKLENLYTLKYPRSQYLLNTFTFVN